MRDTAVYGSRQEADYLERVTMRAPDTEAGRLTEKVMAAVRGTLSAHGCDVLEGPRLYNPVWSAVLNALERHFAGEVLPVTKPEEISPAVRRAVERWIESEKAELVTAPDLNPPEFRIRGRKMSPGMFIQRVYATGLNPTLVFEELRKRYKPPANAVRETVRGRHDDIEWQTAADPDGRVRRGPPLDAASEELEQ